MPVKLHIGQTLPEMALATIQGQALHWADASTPWVHVQFRRFAGCPICNLHLRTMAQRVDEIRNAGIRSWVVFHSSAQEMLQYQAHLPFACIADPSKQLYRRFGVESHAASVLHPRAMLAGLKGLWESKRMSLKAENGVFGLPADFLVSAQGKIVALHYGQHADDHWEVEQLLQYVQQNA